MLESKHLELLKQAVKKLESGFDLPEFSTNYLKDDKLKSILMEVAEKMKDNYPYFHPYYAGQMLKPAHEIPRLAYMLSMWINPNNHALDGGRASSRMEKEAVNEIAAMFDWEEYLGHLTTGGTFANLEALWVAGRINPNKYIVASDMAHYTHSRISDVLRLKYKAIKSDEFGKMDINHLENELKSGEIGTVVVTIGTTGTGSTDPLKDILKLREKYDFRIHIDSAYGGYFRLIDKLDYYTKENYKLMNMADSIVIDPHKHGLQPYGCGCILFKDQSVGKFYLHDSPYTYFSSDELHLGEISLECSRAGASAVALWATQKVFPLEKNSEFAQILTDCRDAGSGFYELVKNDDRYFTLFEPELDIVVWVPKAKTTQEISKLSQELFKQAERDNIFLSILKYPSEHIRKLLPDVKINSEKTVIMRSALMKPEHKDYYTEIFNKMNESYDKIKI